MKGFTPPPWCHELYLDSNLVQRAGSGGFVVQGDNAEADAKLIAKAPEMHNYIEDTAEWLGFLERELKEIAKGVDTQESNWLRDVSKRISEKRAEMSATLGG